MTSSSSSNVFPTDFAVRIRRGREQAGLSQQELAHASGLKQAQISRIEKAKLNDPSISQLLGLASGLRINLQELLADDTTEMLQTISDHFPPLPGSLPQINNLATTPGLVADLEEWMSCKRNILVIGAPLSGKSTLLQALGKMVPGKQPLTLVTDEATSKQLPRKWPRQTKILSLFDEAGGQKPPTCDDFVPPADSSSPDYLFIDNYHPVFELDEAMLRTVSSKPWRGVVLSAGLNKRGEFIDPLKARLNKGSSSDVLAGNLIQHAFQIVIRTERDAEQRLMIAAVDQTLVDWEGQLHLYPLYKKDAFGKLIRVSAPIDSSKLSTFRSTSIGGILA